MKRFQTTLLWLTTLALVAGFASRIGQVQAKGNSESKARVNVTEKSPGQTPEGLSTGDWKSIRQAYDAGNRQIFESKPGEWVTRNATQGWKTEFDGRGARLDTGETRLGLKLERYGFSGATAAVDWKARRVSAAGNRVEYVWDDRLTEWFVNDEKGLEQGWTLVSAPGDATTLRLDVGVSGSLRAKSVDAVSVALLDRNGATVLTYGGLKAWDANGKPLPARFEEVSENRIGVTVETAGAVFPVTVDPTVQQAYLKASNTGDNDGFGEVVAASGDTVVLGVFFEDSSATGINGDQANNSAADSGAVYVFVRNGTTWSQQAYLKASNTEAGDFFGGSVAISGDTLVIGAPREDSNATGVNGNQSNNSASFAGAAYVFVRNGTTWSQQAYLKASNTGDGDEFGFSVAISGDTVTVGAEGESSNATGIDGNQADNSANGSGAVYVFARNGTTWSQQAYLKASNTGAGDNFGYSMAMAGDTVAVGALFEDSGATGVNGGQGDANEFLNAGAVYVFVRNGTTWSQQAYLKASNTEFDDRFGSSVSVSGDTIVVGALNEDSNATGVNGNQANNSASASGAAYVFARNGTTWSQQAYLKASNTNSNDLFGLVVGISGDTIVVGAPTEASNTTGVNGNQSNNSAPLSGAAYVFVRSGTTWSQQSYLKASNTNSNDLFGIGLAVSGDTVVIGASGESSNATGVNGDQANNSSFSSGAGYIFTVPTCPFALSATSANFPPSGGDAGVNLTTPNNCAWSVSGIPSWITNVSPANGTGTTFITYTVSPNLSETPRSATLTIGGLNYTVNQDPSVVVNGSLNLAITTSTVTTASCSPNYANDYLVVATLTNVGSQTVFNPYFRLLELQEAAGTPPPAVPFRLVTADGAACATGGLPGAIQSTDGATPTPTTLPTLAPGQSVTVRFVIALPSIRRFRFIVSAFGSFSSVIPATPANRHPGVRNVVKTATKDTPTRMAFQFVPATDGKSLAAVPNTEIETFPILGDDFRIGLNRTLNVPHSRASR